MKHRALVLSGGGALGALQVGMLLELTEAGYFWHRISGVSVGAVNGALLAQYPATTAGARDGAKRLEALWRTELRAPDGVYKSSALDLGRLLSTGALYDTAPLLGILTKHWSLARNTAAGIEFTVGTVGFYGGAYRSVPAHTPDFVKWIMASACFPLAFPAVMIEGEAWVDGGVRHVLPHHEVFAHGTWSAVDALLCAAPDGTVLPSSTVNAKDALKFAPRIAEVLVGRVVSADVTEGEMLGIQTKTPFNLIAPPTPPTFGSLSFKESAIDAMISWGRTLAHSALERGLIRTSATVA